MFRFISWAKAIMVKIGYLVSHPQALWKESCEGTRARVWAREMAKKASKTE